MTQEEYDQEIIEGKEIMDKIKELLNGKEESVVLNTLLCTLINVSMDLDVEPIQIIMALANGFNLAASKPKQFRPEILN